MKVRTRFAPSPTGFLHVGGVRTALFAWLLARQNNGQFVLRLEDTDKKREVTGADQHIIKSLHWVGIDWDEGPDKGGDFGPYRQSQRLDSYKRWADRLIKADRAYADPFTADEVQRFRELAQKDKKPFLYRNHRPKITTKWDGTTPLRFKSNPKSYTYHDEVMGDISTGPEVIDDFVLIKSDGYPTYNFAHIIDDAEMQISHIIRGQEFISSTPNYLNLYEALGLTPPIIATLPHILGPEGNKKLSKRDGAKDILDYAREGYLPEAMMNFLATMGWNDGSNQEIYSNNELIEKFSLARVQKSGARFDERRLLWLNGAHIRNLPLDKLYKLIENFWPKSSNNFDDNYKLQVLKLVQDRLKFFDEIPELTEFFFLRPKFNDELIKSNKQIAKTDGGKLVKLLDKSINDLSSTEFDVISLKKCLDKLLADTKEKPSILLGIIRIALTRAPASPELAGSLAVIGKDESLSRLKEVMLKLS